MKNLIIVFSFIFILVFLSTCKKESKQNPETDYIIYNNGEGSIGSGGGKITLNENNPQELSVSIDIPPGALAESELISINVSPDSLSNSPYSLGSLIELKPEGLIFNDSVKLTIKLNSPLNQDDNPIIFQYLPKRDYLSYNETFVDKNLNSIFTYIQHFSLWSYLTHPDLRTSTIKSWPVIVDNYPSNPWENHVGLFDLTKGDIMRAFTQWGYYTGKEFYLSTNAEEDNIAVQFITMDEAKNYYGGDPFGPDAIGVSLFHRVAYDHRVILLKDDEKWASTDFVANNAKTLGKFAQYGVEFTVLHEIGHLFGLTDKQTSQDENAVMTPGCPHTFPRALTCTDLAVLNSQYSNSCAVSLNSIGDLNIVAETGSTIQNAIHVKVTDANGNGVPGVTVMFYNDSDIPMEFTKYTATDMIGDAYLSEMHIPQTVGKIPIIVYAYLSNEMKSLTYSIDIKQIENPGSLTDVDGNVYSTVNIGTQVWMKENLKTTKYNDGTAITNVTDNTEWTGLTTEAYCDYDNIPSNSDTYGRLYNWLVAASTNPKNVCPTGWHVPSDMEWTTLENHLMTNGYNYDGTTTGNKYAKSLAGTTFWDPSTIAGAIGNTDFPLYRNKSGFSALPGGDRTTSGDFEGVRLYGLFWSATARDDVSAWSRYLINSYCDVVRSANSSYYTGFSIRCLKDN